LAQAISYPLPPKLFLNNSNASICNHCAILFIKVEDVPKPQFLGNVTSVSIIYPVSDVKKFGF
jgi:hypothetical protein